MMSSSVIRVVAADDHPAILAGVQYALATQETISVVSVAKNPDELLLELSKTDCDVLISDYTMPGDGAGDGLGLFSKILRLYPDLNIVVFTAMNNPVVVQSLLDMGCRCIVSKMDKPEFLVMAVHAAFSGGRYLSSRLMMGVRKHAVEADGSVVIKSGVVNLSARELEVVRLFALGLKVNEIAARLHRSHKTISTQKHSAMEKLGARSDIDLLRYAVSAGLSGDETDGVLRHA
jgi:two-component system, NarL family, captular synthesis response regulator RcsB